MAVEQHTYLGIANVLLDGLTAYDDDLGADPANEAAVRLAMSQLSDLRAVEVTEDELGVLHVHLAPLLVAAMTLLGVVTRQCADAFDSDRDSVVHGLREYLKTEVWPRP